MQKVVKVHRLGILRSQIRHRGFFYWALRKLGNWRAR